jgi:prepilin-type N-terminal cleavage/methylation domain-containing protein
MARYGYIHCTWKQSSIKHTRQHYVCVRRSAPGFTLIELLIVIAIISLLMSILIPALRAVKRQARQVHCAANLRSLNSAVLMYALENKDRLAIKKVGMNPYQLYLGLQSELDNGHPDLRKMFYHNLDGFTRTSGPSQLMFCPAAQPEHDQVRKEISFESAASRWDNGEYTIGYYYWAANEKSYLDVIDLEWYSECDTAFRASDKPWTPIFSDPLEKHHFAPSPWPWGLASHTQSEGTAEYTFDHPLGQNNARLDGSVIFEKFVENNDWADEEGSNYFGDLEAATHIFDDEDILLLWGGM